jgi:hypothetical protein
MYVAENYGLVTFHKWRKNIKRVLMPLQTEVLQLQNFDEIG